MDLCFSAERFVKPSWECSIGMTSAVEMIADDKSHEKWTSTISRFFWIFSKLIKNSSDPVLAIRQYRVSDRFQVDTSKEAKHSKLRENSIEHFNSKLSEWIPLSWFSLWSVLIDLGPSRGSNAGLTVTTLWSLVFSSQLWFMTHNRYFRVRIVAARIFVLCQRNHMSVKRLLMMFKARYDKLPCCHVWMESSK